jgi:hypothetical protein
MSAPISTTEPTALPAGDTAKWRRTYTPWLASDGWALTYTLVNANNRITFAATADGDAHLVNVPTATTAAWAPGTYAWRAQASKAGEVYTAATGSIDILPAWGTAADARSHAAKVLANIEAYLENAANLAAAEYEIAGRSLKRHSLPELLALRDRYRMEVARESAAQRAAAGLAPRGRIAVRFGP